MFFVVIATIGSTPCWVTQSGTDGFGHQLHGTLTVMAMGRGYYYDATDRPYHFEHIRGAEHQHASEYFKNCLRDYRSRYPSQAPARHKFVRLPAKLPSVCDGETVYELDNAFSWQPGKCRKMHRLPPTIKRIFRAHLPFVHLPLNVTVVHVRLGDSKWRGRRALKRKLEWIKARREEVIIHTDDAGFFSNHRLGSNVRVYGPGLDITKVFSHMVHARGFFGADSSLSVAAAFLRNGRALFLKEHLERVGCNQWPLFGSPVSHKLPPHNVF